MSVVENHLTPDLLALLEASELPASDLREGRSATFLSLTSNGELQGCVGLEFSGEIAFLRSLAVRTSARGEGLGRSLVAAAEQRAQSAGSLEMYLLTTGAAPFFELLGYRRVDRKDTPAFVAGSPQFRGLCPASAVLMARRLQG